MAVSLTNVFATTIEEFMANAAAIFGAGTLGETRPRLSAKWSLDTDGKIKSATISMAITSQTAHWAGSGMSEGKRLPQPDGPNRNAIDRVEALNKAHEQKHVDGYQAAFDAKKAETEKKYVGKTPAEAEAVTAEMGQALLDVCEALHKTEGLINFTRQGTTITIAVSPQGPGGCS